VSALGLTWTGFGLGLLATWGAILASPWQLQLLLAAAFIIFTAGFVVSVVVYLALPNEGDHAPRAWKWHKHRLRKLSWNFGSILSLNIDDGVFHVRQFVCSFKVNRGEGIRPKRGFLDCKKTGRRIPLYVECGNPYVRAELIEFIPTGKWFYCCAAFRKDGSDATDVNAPYDASEKISPTAEEFFARYNDFEFVFEYDDKTFRKKFSRPILEGIINRARAANLPKSDPTPRRKDATEQA
jgi:hypothetical protein